MAIHEHLGLDRKTIRQYLSTEGPLQPRESRRRASILDPYYDYILLRWGQGCHNGQLLLNEVRAKGYSGGDSLVRALVARLRKNLPVRAPTKGTSPATIRTTPASPRELRWLLAKRPEELDAEEQADLARLLQVGEEVRLLHCLLQSFLQMVRERQSKQLSSWLSQAEQSAIPELKSCVVGIERDRAAVESALRLPWSQGSHGLRNEITSSKGGRTGSPLTLYSERKSGRMAAIEARQWKKSGQRRSASR